MALSVNFRNPPIVELAIGVQFSPLVNFNTGHMGWFWKSCLGQEWERATDALAIPDQFETFDEQRGWRLPNIQVLTRIGLPPQRLQISTADGERMIQLQSSRFLYNWQKKDQQYPSYDAVRDQFISRFAEFGRFIEEGRLGELVPNQWEITYVDHIPQGVLWQSPSDWCSVLSGLLGPEPGHIEKSRLESLAGEWHYEIMPKLGRLHLTVQHGLVGEKRTPTLLLSTTARGPISKELGIDLTRGLDIGHEAIHEAFFKVTSLKAQNAWEKVNP